MSLSTSPAGTVRLGLRANLAQFTLLVAVNACAAGIAATALSRSLPGFTLGAVLLGLGTAMVYPTLLAAVGDVAHPAWRASAVGVYRFWRDCGYTLGALLAGVTADAFGMGAAVWLTAVLTFASGVVVAARMSERYTPMVPS
jgi:MFS family permease